MAEKTLKKDSKSVSEIKTPEAPPKKHADYTLEVLTDYDGQVDPFYLPVKAEGYVFRFLNDNPINIREKTSKLLFQKGGWQLCPGDFLIERGMVKKEELSPDGFFRSGFTILAFMPKELFEKKQAYKQKQANRPMDAIEKMMNEGDRTNPELLGLGGKDQVGLQTKDQLKWKD